MGDERQERVEIMKRLVRQLHDGKAPEQVKQQLETMLAGADYADVFRMEVQLIEEGIPQESIQALCDTHTRVLKKHLDQQETPQTTPGHPVHTFVEENKAIQVKIDSIKRQVAELEGLAEDADALSAIRQLQTGLNELMDIDKHYRRKENLVFPFFEKKNVPGVPAVMWGKDDEVRNLLKTTLAGLQDIDAISGREALAFAQLAILPAVEAVAEMIYKEEKVFLPTALDLLSDAEWYEIYTQTAEIGYCLIAPDSEWKPADIDTGQLPTATIDGKVQLPTGSLTLTELVALFNTLPFDITFVDKEDSVRFFSEGPDRIFERTRTVLGRKVQYCHPPSSVQTVNRILADFKAGEQNQARFWIKLGGRLVYIVYYAVRDEAGDYLGTLEVTQDLTELQQIEGEQRLLSYDDKD